MSKTSIECELIQNNAPQIHSLVCKIREGKYDVIITMSRKAPRLLEVLSFFGFDFGKPLIITEKAVYFLPKEFFRGKNVLILDDIIIVGTTIYNYLKKKFDGKLSLCKNLSVHVLAIDSEWYQSKLFELLVKKGNIISLPSSEMTLKHKQTPLFCNQVVKSFRYSDRPYNMDFCMIYHSLEESFFDYKENWSDRIIETSSIFQREIDRRSFTAIPEPTVVTDFLNLVLNPNIRSSFDIGRYRIYYNTINNQVLLFPTISIDIEKKYLLSPTGPFNKRFDIYNKLLEEIPFTSELDDLHVSKIKYSLFCYILSYLWGLSFIIRNNLFHTLNGPNRFLKCQDLVYLFGPFFKKNILNTISNYFNETMRLLTYADDSSKKQNLENSMIQLTSPDSWEDEKAKQLYKKIKPHIDSLKAYLEKGYLQQQVSSIFEGLFFKVELDVREKLKERLSTIEDLSKIDTILHSIKYVDRLNLGFTWEQLISILYNEGFIIGDNRDIELRIPLVIDLLVDLGVTVPIRYYDEKNTKWEWRYRVGEDPLSAEKTAYIFSTINSEVIGDLHEIAREKIFVMLLEKARKEKYTDDVLAPVEDEEIVKLDIGLCIHGAVLQEDLSKRFYSSWLENYGGPYVPVTESTLADMFRYAKSLVHIEKEIDKSRNIPTEDIYINIEGRYLVTLSTLYNYEIYLEAIMQEINIFFSEYSKNIKNPIQDLFDFISDLKKVIKIDESLVKKKDYLRLFSKEKLSNPDKALNQIFLKNKYFTHRKKIAERIDNYFSSLSFNNNTRLNYTAGKNFSLKNKIEQIIRSPEPEPNMISLIKSREAEILLFGDVCRDLSELVNLSRLILDFFLTRTKRKKINKKSKRAIELRLNMFIMANEKGSIDVKNVKKLEQGNIPNDIMKQLNLSSYAVLSSVNENEWLIYDIRKRIYRIKNIGEKIKIYEEGLVYTLNYKLRNLHMVYRTNQIPHIISEIPLILNDDSILNFMSNVILSAENVFLFLKELYQKEKNNWKKDIIERLFPLEIRNGIFCIINYDIKKSSPPGERLKGSWTIEDANNMIRQNYADQIKNKTIIIEYLHEEGYIFTKTIDLASDIILSLVRAAERNKKQIRIALLSTQDTINFKWKRKYKYDGECELITDRLKDNEIDINYIVPKRFNETAESYEDKKENRDKNNIIIKSLDDSVHTFALSRNIIYQLYLDSEIDKFYRTKYSYGDNVSPREQKKIYDVYIVKPQFIVNFLNQISPNELQDRRLEEMMR